MSDSAEIQETLADKISYYHLAALLASLPFDMFYSHLILISYIIHTLIHLKKSNIKPVFTKSMLLLQSVFIITVFSTIYATNKNAAFGEWGGHITIFIFPIVFCLNPLDIRKYLPKLLTIFAVVCSLVIAYFYYDAIRVIGYYHLPLNRLFTSAFTNHNFSEPFDLHATFFSMQVAVALVYVLTVLVKNQTVGYRKAGYAICALILTAGLIQLSAKSVFGVVLVVINAAIPYFLLTGKKRVRYFAVSLSISVAAVLIIVSVHAFRERYFNELKSDLTATPPGAPIDSRMARWHSVMGLVEKKPIIGYGAGSEIDLLQKAYFDDKVFNSFINRLNAHSEYLSILLKSGIIGLAIYLATIAFGFVVAFKKRDIMLFTFILLIATVSFSENLLDVDKGVIFYAFFFSLFFFANQPKKHREYFVLPVLDVLKQSDLQPIV